MPMDRQVQRCNVYALHLLRVYLGACGSDEVYKIPFLIVKILTKTNIFNFSSDYFSFLLYLHNAN